MWGLWRLTQERGGCGTDLGSLGKTLEGLGMRVAGLDCSGKITVVTGWRMGMWVGVSDRGGGGGLMGDVRPWGPLVGKSGRPLVAA